jgi:hypothetical protein
MHSALVGTDQISFFLLIVSRNFLLGWNCFSARWPARSLFLTNYLPQSSSRQKILMALLGNWTRRNFFLPPLRCVNSDASLESVSLLGMRIFIHSNLPILSILASLKIQAALETIGAFVVTCVECCKPLLFSFSSQFQKSS